MANIYLKKDNPYKDIKDYSDIENLINKHDEEEINMILEEYAYQCFREVNSINRPRSSLYYSSPAAELKNIEDKFNIIVIAYIAKIGPHNHFSLLQNNDVWEFSSADCYLTILLSTNLVNDKFELNEKINEDILKHFNLLIENATEDRACIFPKRLRQAGLFLCGIKKYKEAKKYFECGAKLDYSGRQINLPFELVDKCKIEIGYLYHYGLGVPKDIEKAKQIYKETCDGNDYFTNYLGDMILESGESFDNYDEVLKYYFKDSFIDYPRNKPLFMKIVNNLINKKELTYFEQYCLSLIYKNGVVIDKDTKLSHKLLTNLFEKLSKNEKELNFEEKNLYFRCNEYFENNVKSKTQRTINIKKDLKINDIITFGEYKNEPLIWKVTNIENNTISLITEKAVIVAPIGEYYSRGMYECDLFSYLNNNLLPIIFTKDEQKLLVEYKSYYAGTMKLFIPHVSCRDSEDVKSLLPFTNTKYVDSYKCKKLFMIHTNDSFFKYGVVNEKGEKDFHIYFDEPQPIRLTIQIKNN